MQKTNRPPAAPGSAVPESLAGIEPDIFAVTLNSLTSTWVVLLAGLWSVALHRTSSSISNTAAATPCLKALKAHDLI